LENPADPFEGPELTASEAKYSHILPAHPAVLTFEFTGETNDIGYDTGGYLDGVPQPIPVSGRYSFDPFTPDLDPEPKSGTYLIPGNGSGMELEFAGYSIGAAGESYVMYASDEPEGNPGDWYGLRHRSLASTSALPTDWRYDILFDVYKGSPSELLTSDDLPLVPPDISIPGAGNEVYLASGPDGFGALHISMNLLTFTVEPQVVADCLAGKIEELIWAGVLNKGNGNALITKVNNAFAKAVNGKTGTAVNGMESFINEVEAFVRSGKLTAEQGQGLIALAEALVTLWR
jgi:hypothetical protein